MCPDHGTVNSRGAVSRSEQQGFALVTAIFLLLMFAGLAAFIATFSSVQNATSAQDIQGTRAYQAARSGMEWGVYQALRNAICSGTSTVPLTGGLADFSVSVSFTAFSYSEGVTSGTVCRITSTASFGTLGTSTYVERQLESTVGQ